MSDRRNGTAGSEGLSMETLLLASLSSAAAAIVTSQFWRGGAVVTAALTPVIVAVSRELLKKPTERISSRITTRRASTLEEPVALRTGRFDRRGEGAAGGRSAATITAERSSAGEGGEPAPGPIRVYRRRAVRPGLAVATGVAAFLVAAAALTLPEVIFGGSVAGGGRDTTFFGGGAGEDRDSAVDEPEGGSDPSGPRDAAPERPQDGERPQRFAPEPPTGSAGGSGAAPETQRPAPGATQPQPEPGTAGGAPPVAPEAPVPAPPP